MEDPGLGTAGGTLLCPIKRGGAMVLKNKNRKFQLQFFSSLSLRGPRALQTA
jgi:hypothetical protein